MRSLSPYLTKFMLTVLALQILNLSIYNTSFYANDIFAGSKNQVKDDNPIDSFAEFIVEDLGGVINAFPEQPDNRNSSKQSGELKHNITFKMVFENRFEQISLKPVFIPDSRTSDLPEFRNNYSYLFWKEINHPPS